MPPPVVAIRNGSKHALRGRSKCAVCVAAVGHVKEDGIRRGRENTVVEAAG